MSELHSFSEDECWRRLTGPVVGRVGFDMGRGLRIHPVNYAVDGRSVVVRTDPASELARCVRLFADGASVAFEVDQVDAAARTGWSVLVGGRLSEIVDATEARRVADAWGPEPQPSGDRDLWVRITPVEVTGRTLDRPADQD